MNLHTLYHGLLFLHGHILHPEDLVSNSLSEEPAIERDLRPSQHTTCTEPHRAFDFRENTQLPSS